MKWSPINDLYQQATLKAKLLGRVLLSKSSTISCYFYLVKQQKKYRIKFNLSGHKVRSSQSKKHQQWENEPWLIASSLCTMTADEIISLYKKRMQIEEAFRDLKSTRNGFGLRHCRSFSKSRLWVALLISNLSALALWLFAIVVKSRQLHYPFQANTEKTRNVLSYFTLGWQAIRRPDIQFKRKELMGALITIAAMVGGLYG